ncbi:MAG TPA: XRE family transcriptional regulator [Candidatus Binatia bacterium]|jgi:transcriptional regulator with XRE-family HTH domain
MAKTLAEKMKTIGEDRRKKIEARAAFLIAEETTLRDLREALDLTQQQVASSLHISQDGVSRLERRTDFLISTLRNFVKAMGGQLHVVANFPNRPPVELSGFANMKIAHRKRREEDARE